MERTSEMLTLEMRINIKRQLAELAVMERKEATRMVFYTDDGRCCVLRRGE